MAESASTSSEGKFDIKGCFVGVKINGKPSWNPPTGKDSNGYFEPLDRSGALTFIFTINPILYKIQQAALQKLADAQPPSAGGAPPI